jgi:hypothetical protein
VKQSTDSLVEELYQLFRRPGLQVAPPRPFIKTKRANQLRESSRASPQFVSPMVGYV